MGVPLKYDLAITPRFFWAQRSGVNRTNRTVFWFLFAIYFFCPQFAKSSFSQNTPPEIDWLKGKELSDSANLAITAQLMGSPIRDRLLTFAEKERVGIFVDRRVDVSKRLNFGVTDLTRDQLLWKIADETDIGVCQIGDAYYFGPQEVAAILPVLLYELKKESARLKRNRDTPKWTDRAEISWARFSEPKKLVEALCAANSIELTNTNAIPHDLWPATSLPKLSLDQRLALLVLGFDGWIERSSRGNARIIPFPNPEKGTCEIKNVKAASAVARRLKAEFTDVRFSASGKTIKATGSINDLTAARKWIVDQQIPITGNPDNEVFDINTTAQRGSILSSLANQMGVRLSFAPEQRPILAESISIKMIQQPATEIIRKTLEGTGLKYRVDDSQLSIFK